MERQTSRGSIGSTKSKASKYRAIAATSHVDESLFGNGTGAKGRAGGAPPAPTGRGGAKNASRGPSMAGTGRKAFAPSSTLDNGLVTIGKGDLQRMMGPSCILTPEEASRIRQERDAVRQQEDLPGD